MGTHFDYNNHITFISTNTKISTHMKLNERHPFHANRSEFPDLAFSNIAATFRQCLSPFVSKLSTLDKNQKFRQGLLVNTYQCLLAPHENMHPSKISTHSGC